MSQPAAGVPSAAREYATVAADIDADSATILSLWREGLAQSGVPEAKLEWYYRRNPQGSPQVTLLRHGTQGEAAGVAAVAPRRMQAGARPIIAGVLVDFVVRPKDRTAFAALTLQRDVRRRAYLAFPLVFGLPNRQSMPVFRRLGYRHAADMERRVRVLRSAAYLSRYLPGWLGRLSGPIFDQARVAANAVRRLGRRSFRAQWVERADAAFDALWERAAMQGGIMGVRDSEFLNWRFVNCPAEACRFFTLQSESDGRLVAYAACAPHQGSLKILDFLADPGFPGALTGLLIELVHDAYAAGYSSLAVEFCGDNATRQTLQRMGFVVRDKRPLYAGGEACEPLLANAGWHLTCADEDW